MIISHTGLEMSSPLQPSTIDDSGYFAKEYIIGVLTMLLIVATALLIGLCITKIMTKKGFMTNLTANLIVSSLLPVLMFLRYGVSLALVQGVFLMFILLYATYSDLTSHTVDDYISLMIFALGLSSIATVGLSSMLFGAFAVFVPQIAMSLIPKCKPLGGADLKISTVIAFLLGWERGIIAFVAGLIIAVVYMAIYNRVKNKKSHSKENTEQPFALIPFLSIAAMALFMF